MNMWQTYIIATASYLEQKHSCESGQAARLLFESLQAKRKLLHHADQHRETTTAEFGIQEEPALTQVAQSERACRTTAALTALASLPGFARSVISATVIRARLLLAILSGRQGIQAAR
jgi:hypothetical protein